MQEQLTFNLPFKTAFGRDDFFLTSANSSASQEVENWADWINGTLLLIGPSGSGKTHLSQIWADNADARVLPAVSLSLVDLSTLEHSNLVIDDIHQIQGDSHSEQTLFHVVNMVRDTGRSMLLNSQDGLSTLSFNLPDLQSRIRSMQVARLNDPDDNLFLAVMIKQFEDRQIAIDLNVITYLQKRIDRSFAAVRSAVEKIDKAALRDGRKITKQYVSSVLNS